MTNLERYPTQSTQAWLANPASAKAGGGYVWDAVQEYRVWCHPERGAQDLEEGSDYFYSFITYQEAKAFSEQAEGAEEPVALILQEEYIDEPKSGQYVHVKEARVAEWPAIFLSRPKRTAATIPTLSCFQCSSRFSRHHPRACAGRRSRISR